MFDQAHGLHVAGVAGQLFGAVQELHGLGEADRRYIVAAALLCSGLALGLLLIRGIEQEHQRRGESAAAQSARQELQIRSRQETSSDGEWTDDQQTLLQKSVPMATLEPLLIRWKSRS